MLRIVAMPDVLDLLAPLKSSPPLEEARARIRGVSPPIEGDRPYHRDIAALEGLIAGGALGSL